MKYIVTESQYTRLKEYMKKFLEKKVNWEKPYGNDSFLIVKSKDDGNYEHGDYVLPAFEYDSYDQRLWVNRELFDTMNNWFGLSEQEMEPFFKSWFEKKYNVDISYLEIKY